MAPERKDLSGEARDFALDVGKDLRTTAVKETSKRIVSLILWGLALIAGVLFYALTGLSERETGILQGFALFGLLNLLLHGLRLLYLHLRKGREIVVIENESAAINRIREARKTCTDPVRFAYGYVNRVCRSEDATSKDGGVIADLLRGEILPRCIHTLEQFEGQLKEPGVTVADRDKLFKLFGDVMYSVYPRLIRLIRVQLSYILGFERVFQSSEYAELQRLDGLMQEEIRRLYENPETRPVTQLWCIGELPPLTRPSATPPPSTASEPDPPSSLESS